MTYKEVLNSLADQTADTYNSYLQSKISLLTSPGDFSADKTDQYRSEYERLEKKLVALMATLKNEEGIDIEAPDTFYEDFIK